MTELDTRDEAERQNLQAGADEPEEFLGDPAFPTMATCGDGITEPTGQVPRGHPVGTERTKAEIGGSGPR